MALTAPSAKKASHPTASTKGRAGPKKSSSVKKESKSVKPSPAHVEVGLGELCSSAVLPREKARRNHLSRSRAYLRSSCTFSDGDFVLLHNQLKDDLSHPSNLVGLTGPQKGKESFESWLIDYMDAGIGAAYWGTDRGRTWDYSTDEGRENIRVFLRQLVKFAGSELRKKKRRSSIIEGAASVTSRKARFSPTGPEHLNNGEDNAQEAPTLEAQQKRACRLNISSTTPENANNTRSPRDDDAIKNSTGGSPGMGDNEFVIDYSSKDRPYIF